MADPEIVVRATGDFARLNSDLDRTESRFGKFGRNVARGLITTGVLGTAALVKLGIESSKSASNAEQSLGATESVFGKYADVVIRRSRQAADAVGLSANEYRELSNVTGAMLQSAGTPLRSVAKLTGDLNRRAADMAATFGGPTSEAVQAISSLLRGETDPIERYGVSIKQSDVNARLAARGLDKLTGSALKQAEQQVRLELLFGQTARTQGAFRRESGTLANQGQKLDAGFENLKTTLGKGLNPALTAGAQLLNREVLPPLQKLASEHVPKAGRAFEQWLGDVDLSTLGADAKDLIDGIDWSGFGRSLGDLVEIAREAGPAFGEEMGDGMRVAGTLLSFLADHTDELADAMPYLVAGLVAYKAAQLANNVVGRDSLIGFGLQIASTVSLSRANRALAVSLREVNAAQASQVGGITAATGSMSKLQIATRGAAGIGGMAALAHSTQQTNDKLGILESTAGGALLGFSVGGPWGAAIGAGAGALLGLATQTDKTKEAAIEGTTEWQHYAATLNDVSAATSAATREMAYQALQEQGLLQAAGDLGISQQTLLNGVLGREQASRRLRTALDKEAAALEELIAARDEEFGQMGVAYDPANDTQVRGRMKNLEALEAEIGAVRKSVREKVNEIAVVKRIPRRVVTEFLREGVPKGIKDVRALVRQYELTPKQIRTIVQAANVDVSRKQLRELVADVKAVDRAEGRAQIKADTKSLDERMRHTRQTLEDLDKRAPATPKVALDLSAFNTQRQGLIVDLNTIPDEHVTIWLDRKYTGGTGGGSGGSSSDRTAPRETVDPLGVGRMIATVELLAPRAEAAGKGVIARLLAGITGGSDKVRSALDKLTKYIEKRIDLQDPKAERARERAVLARLKGEYTALIRNGKAQDAVNRKLERAREHLAEVRGFRRTDPAVVHRHGQRGAAGAARGRDGVGAAAARPAPGQGRASGAVRGDHPGPDRRPWREDQQGHAAAAPRCWSGGGAGDGRGAGGWRRCGDRGDQPADEPAEQHRRAARVADVGSVL